MVNIAEDVSQQSDEIIQTLTGFQQQINRVAFTDLNKTLLSAGDDGTVRRWDLEVFFLAFKSPSTASLDVLDITKNRKHQHSGNAMPFMFVDGQR